MFIVLPSLKAQDKPNVLFIAIHDLNDFVNFLDGAIHAKTPNIDKLAKAGTLFTNAHCQAPICGPSRASIMTGLYPVNSGNYLQLNDTDIKKSNKLTAQAIFMPDYFEQNGYKTMAVGEIYHQGDRKRLMSTAACLMALAPDLKSVLCMTLRKFKGKNVIQIPTGDLSLPMIF